MIKGIRKDQLVIGLERQKELDGKNRQKQDTLKRSRKILEEEQKDIHKMKTMNLKKSELRVKKTVKSRMAGKSMEQPTS